MQSKQLEGVKILICLENRFDDLELFYFHYRMIEEGAEVVVAAHKAKETYTSLHDYPCEAEISFKDVNESDFHAIYVPGGYAPDQLRQYSTLLEKMQQFHQKEKLIAFICHGAWVPVSAKVIKGVKCTSYPGIQDDLTNAGAYWVNEPVVVDRHFISSRRPYDLPYFCPAVIEWLKNHRQ